MNISDAERFAKKCGAKHVVPIHYGMFDELDASKFESEKKVLPKIWEEIKF